MTTCQEWTLITGEVQMSKRGKFSQFTVKTSVGGASPIIVVTSRLYPVHK